MFEVNHCGIPGCHEIQPRIFSDIRGSFVKVFQKEVFGEFKLETEFSEEYYSTSRRGVQRGLHFQTPPADHVKMIYCIQGEVFDVALDIRVGSPAYGNAATFTLGASKGNVIYLPKGVAHGFCVMSESATLVYKVSSVHSSAHDTGILWSSAGIDWPVTDPVLSDRDQNLMPFPEFKSPFVYAK